MCYTSYVIKGNFAGFIENIVVITLAAVAVNKERRNTRFSKIIMVAIGGLPAAHYLRAVVVVFIQRLQQPELGRKFSGIDYSDAIGGIAHYINICQELYPVKWHPGVAGKVL